MLIQTNAYCFVQKLKRVWTSILNHVSNVHEWNENGQQCQCAHAPLTVDAQRKKMWLKRDTLAFEELSSLVQDKRLLKDMEKMGLYKHTGENISLPVYNIVLPNDHSLWGAAVAQRSKRCSWAQAAHSPPEQSDQFLIFFLFPFSFHSKQVHWKCFTMLC